MRDAELCQELLGLSSPWAVTRVALDVDARRVDVWAEAEPGTMWPCPICERKGSTYDHTAERAFKGADVARAAAILRLTWDEAWHLVERAVARGQSAQRTPVPTHLGVDEKAIARGPKYATIVYDLDRGTVVDLARDRQKESLAGYDAGLTPTQRASIHGVSMDLWAPFREATLAALPDAAGKIVYDRFHVTQILIDARVTGRAARRGDCGGRAARC